MGKNIELSHYMITSYILLLYEGIAQVIRS